MKKQKEKNKRISENSTEWEKLYFKEMELIADAFVAM